MHFFFYCADQKGEPRYARDKKKKDDSLASINQGPGGERAGIPRTEVAWQAHSPTLVRSTNRNCEVMPMIEIGRAHV